MTSKFSFFYVAEKFFIFPRVEEGSVCSGKRSPPDESERSPVCLSKGLQRFFILNMVIFYCRTAVGKIT